MAKKVRRWSNLEGVVPEAPTEISPRELKIRETCDERRAKGLTMKDFALEWRALDEEEDFAKVEAAARSVRYAALERLILAELKTIQDLSGQDTWRGEGCLFSPSTSVIPVVTDRAVLMRHIEDTKQQALLTLEFSKLKSLVVNKLDELEAMTPTERAALPPEVTLATPLPGVKIFILPGVHPTIT